MRRIIVHAVAVLGLALACHSASAAGLLRVIVVQASDLHAYLHEIDTLRGQFKKAGVAVTIRAFRARFAGSEAGAVVVSVEMADLATLAKVDNLQNSNADIVATMERIAKNRKIVSDSLYEELTK